MSRLIFTTILNEVLSGIDLHIILSDYEREQLYKGALHYFGLIGALNACEALEAAWQDSYNQNEIREFILAWLKKKAKKTKKAAGVI